MGNLKDIRKKKRLTQTKVQMETGIDRSLLSKYERGERQPTIDNLVLLAKLYGTNLEYLLDMTDKAAPIE